MRCKGGGRESGQARMKSESAQGVGQSDSAAANPVACPHGMTVCQYCGFERIRALEAELDSTRAAVCASVEALGYPLGVDYCSHKSRAAKAEAERDALKERLNEAEIKALQARVKELESGERFTETMFRKLEKAGWKFDELRGEDSG